MPLYYFFSNLYKIFSNYLTENSIYSNIKIVVYLHVGQARII